MKGESWKDGPEATAMDIKSAFVKGNRLIVTLPGYDNPQEISIKQVLNDGDLFAFQPMWGGRVWMRTSDITILAVLPNPDNIRRLT